MGLTGGDCALFWGILDFSCSNVFQHFGQQSIIKKHPGEFEFLERLMISISKYAQLGKRDKGVNPMGGKYKIEINIPLCVYIYT